MRRTIGHRSSLGLIGLGPFPLVSVAVVAAAVGFATYGLAGRVDAKSEPAAAAAPQAQSLHGAAPGPLEFARQLTGLANQFATEGGRGARLDNVDCVQGSRGHYMCSFALLRPPKPPECHLIQAIWTPTELDSFKVTLSGLTARCGSVREAVRSLQ